MKPSSLKAKSLSGKIFKTFSIFTVVAIVAFSLVVSTIFYFTYEQEAERNLSILAHDAAVSLNNKASFERVHLINEQVTGQVRYSLIDSDGTVIFDSYQGEGELENHASRPEIQEALLKGQSTILRYSQTLQTDTVYAAVRLDDGTVIRLAETRHSLLNFLGGITIPLTISLIIAVSAVFFLSRVLTRRIMKPIDALNFEKPLDNEIYEEMNPLLKRIDEQQAMLKSQNEELAQAENMRREFSSNVSHEMKTPLQVISGYAELLKNDMVKPEDRQHFAGLIYDEAQAMRSLINDVLTLSQLDESALGDDRKIIDLYPLALNVAGRLQSFADNNEISVKVEGCSAQVVGNGMLLEEMLYNLIENGIRYNSPGGSVLMAITQQNESTVVVVEDTGLGIPDDMKDKIFERFFRIDKSRSKETGGTGLGLAIVKHAVLYHGGSIEMQSELGKGTSFLVRFPVVLKDRD